MAKTHQDLLRRVRSWQIDGRKVFLFKKGTEEYDFIMANMQTLINGDYVTGDINKDHPATNLPSGLKYALAVSENGVTLQGMVLVSTSPDEGIKVRVAWIMGDETHFVLEASIDMESIIKKMTHIMKADIVDLARSSLNAAPATQSPLAAPQNQLDLLLA